MIGLTAQLGAGACLGLDVVVVGVVGGRAQLLDSELLRRAGIRPKSMRTLMVKSAKPLRADILPTASQVLVAQVAGPMGVGPMGLGPMAPGRPADLPWQHFAAGTRPRPRCAVESAWRRSDATLLGRRRPAHRPANTPRLGPV